MKRNYPEIIIEKNNFDTLTPVDDIIHSKLIDMFHLYLIIGGMPAVVKKYLETNENVVNFQKSNKVNFLLIGAGVLVIIGTTCLIIFIKRKNK